jgi:hypothetical protein
MISIAQHGLQAPIGRLANAALVARIHRSHDGL